MGRPLNKRLFTTAAGGATAGANEIKVNFSNGSTLLKVLSKAKRIQKS